MDSYKLFSNSCPLDTDYFLPVENTHTRLNNGKEEKWFFFLLWVSFDSLLIAKDMPAPGFLNDQQEPNHCLLKVYAPAVSASVTRPLWEVWTPRCATAFLLHIWVMTTIPSLLFMGSWVVEGSLPSDPLPWEPLHRATHMVAGFIRVTQGECERQKRKVTAFYNPILEIPCPHYRPILCLKGKRWSPAHRKGKDNMHGCVWRASYGESF